MWIDGRRQRPAWSVLQEDCAALNTPRPIERPCVASSDEGAIANSEGAGWIGKDGRQKIRWSYPYDIDERQTPSVGYHYPRYLRPLLHRWYGSKSNGCCWPSSSKQDSEIHDIKHDASLHSDCNRDGRCMEQTSYRICQRARKKRWLRWRKNHERLGSYFRDSQLRYREGMRSRSEIHSQPSSNVLTKGMSFHDNLLIKNVQACGSVQAGAIKK